MDRRGTDQDETASGSAARGGVLLAKLSLPRLAQGIARPRLFETLDAGRRGAATWIAAPGGAGKTTLAATYLLERQLPYLWYQLDEDDADPATFFYYLGIAAKQATPDADIHLPLLTPEYLPDIPGFARRYFRALYARLPRDAVLILDNYQDLGESPILADVLHSALDEIPEHGHLLVISRGDPPPVLAGHRATGALALLDWETLRLTLEETEAIVAYNLRLDGRTLRALHQRADGWPAGITLLLEHFKRKGADDWSIGIGALETVFDFFANEFFDDLPPTTRDFLLKTALLAHLTPTLAEQISGNPEAGSILTDLHRRHFFIHRRDLEEASYQYHALFREFLLAKARKHFPRDPYLALIRQAGRLLGECQRQEESVALYLQAQDWETAIPSLLEQAPQLLAQGRAQIMAAWLEQLPPQLVETTPWLLYWKGMSKQFVDPFVAKEILERAYHGFVAANDAMGQVLAASAVIEIIYNLRLGFKHATPWIDALQEQLDLQPSLPEAALEARILASLMAVLPYMRPHDSQLPHYAERLLRHLDGDLDINQKLYVSGHLLYYHSFISGELHICDRIISQYASLLQAPEALAISQLFWRHMCISPLLIKGDLETAAEINRPTLALVRQNNLAFLELVTCFFVSAVRINLGDLKSANELFERMEQLLHTAHPLDHAWYNFQKFLYCISVNDLESGVSHGQAAIEIVNSQDSISFSMVIGCLVAVCYCDMGKYEEARAYLEVPKTHAFGGSPFIHHQVLLIESYISLLLEDVDKCHERFHEAIAVAGGRPFFGSTFWWFPKRMMSRLCAEALRARIEVDYVRQLIRERKLLPEDTAIEYWPWPVRIYTLGCFKVMVEGQAIGESKAGRKALTLLSALIALGAAGVRVDRVAELLWPDAEGDAAISAFATTVSRLRKLIGDEAIIVKGGRVSIDDRRCWIDIRMLESQLDQLDKTCVQGALVREYAEKLLQLYHGPFLCGEEDEWVLRPRDRLREKFARTLARCVIALTAMGEREAAAGLLEKGMDVDPDATRLYRELMLK